MTLTDWLKEKILGQQPQYPTTAYAYQAVPARVPVQAAIPSDNPAASVPATLVASSAHTKGVSNDNRSSLISGR